MKYEPRPEQAYCISRVLDTPNIALFLGMGMGKTAIVLTAANYMQRNCLLLDKVLIVAPPKVTLRTWQREAAKWDHLKHMRFVLVKGTPKQRKKKLQERADVYLISRDLVDWIVPYYKNAWPFDMVVLDESSSFKSAKSRRFMFMRKVRPHIQRMVLLTGTPAPQSYADLYSQFHLLDGGQRLGSTLTEFRQRYMAATHQIAPNVFNYVVTPRGKAEIEAAIADITVCLRSEDYINLPPITYETIPVVLDEQSRLKYDGLRDEALLELAEKAKAYQVSTPTTGRVTFPLPSGVLPGDMVGVAEWPDFDARHEKPSIKIETNMTDLVLHCTPNTKVEVTWPMHAVVESTNAAALNMKLLQLCNGSVYDDNGDDRDYHFVHDCKVSALMELLDSLLYEGRHVLLYYSFKFDIPTIQEAVGKKYKIRLLKNAQDEDDWNAGKIDILLAHPASAAYGLNIQDGGSDIIWYGLPTSLELYEQGNARLQRPGQDKPVFVYLMSVENSRDEDIQAILEEKGNVQEGLRKRLQADLAAVERRTL